MTSRLAVTRSLALAGLFLLAGCSDAEEPAEPETISIDPEQEAEVDAAARTLEQAADEAMKIKEAEIAEDTASLSTGESE